jgi:hypothetical protein
MAPHGLELQKNLAADIVQKNTEREYGTVGRPEH